MHDTSAKLYAIFPKVEKFARSNREFLKAFSEAMNKVIENTKGVDLYEVGGKTSF